MTANGLVAFLRARLDEDEAGALAGISGQADPENGWGYSGRALTPHVGIIHEPIQAAHIIRWHPARVLADVEAKRRIVEVHDSDGGHECVDGTNGSRRDPYIGYRADCLTLRLLVLPFADHPEYREEWRP